MHRARRRASCSKASRSRAATARWITRLRGKDLHNGALVALDYRTGDVLAYVGSAGYARDDMASKRVRAEVRRRRRWGAPAGLGVQADPLRGRVRGQAPDPGQPPARRHDRVRPRPGLGARATPTSSSAARSSCARRSSTRSTSRPSGPSSGSATSAVAETAEALGIRFAGGRKAFLQAGLAGALGTVEVRPLDLTSAYGALANGGVRVPPRMILEVRSADGRVVWRAPGTPSAPGHLRPGRLPRHRHPGRQHRPRAERRSGPRSWRSATARAARAGRRRPRPGTAQRRPRPRDLRLPAAARGPGAARPRRRRLDGQQRPLLPARAGPGDIADRGRAAVARVRPRLHQGLAIVEFEPPKGVVTATIDAWSGGRPGPWTRERTEEWFIDGTQPGARGDRSGRPAVPRACGGWRVDPVKAELGPDAWDPDVRDWIRRARRGPGVVGRLESETAYLTGERSWGGRLIGSCSPPRAPPPKAQEKSDDSENDEREKDKEDKKDNGGGGAP